MEEIKKNSETADESETGMNTEDSVAEKETKEETRPQIPVRSYMLMFLAGLYIIYTGYRLCKNVMDGVEGGGAGFFAVGVAFIAIGAAMIFFGIRGYSREEKRKKAEEAAEMSKAQEETPKVTQSSAKMSIAERAKLTEHLSEEEETEEEAEEEIRDENE